MTRREFDEVWDRDLMKQQLGELRAESLRLKRELERAKKAQDQTWRETAELRRLVQDGHLREKHLRARYLELLSNVAPESLDTPEAPEAPEALDAPGEPFEDSVPAAPKAPTAPGAATPPAMVARSADGPGERAMERVDPTLVERAGESEAADDGWPTPESTLPTLAAHPGWGNYANMGQENVVIGVSLLGLDRNARQEVIDLVAAQQLRNPQLHPIFLTDDDDFRALRAEHFVFEYLPPWPGAAVVPSKERWEAFLLDRLSLIKRKWGVRRFVSFSSSGFNLAEVDGSDAETVQRGLIDAAKE